MRALYLPIIGLIATASGVQAQTQSTQDGQAVQRALEEKAMRIPANELAAALSSSRDGRSHRARIVRRLPDWAAVRAELRRTAEEDEERNANQETKTSPTLQRRLKLPPPPPGLRSFAADKLPRTDSAEVDIITIPVLAPAHPDVRNKLKVYGQKNTYTAVGDIDHDASLSISGACNRVIGGAPDTVNFRKRIAKGPPRLLGLRANYHISHNDFGVDLSFSKFGCGYVITIECGAPDDDDRCAQDTYITMVAGSMILINPALAGGGE